MIMNKPRACGCKGRRTCLLCEKIYDLKLQIPILRKEDGTYIYCPFCNKAWPGWSMNDNSHPNHKGEPMEYPGIYIDLNFLSEAEETDLITTMDSMSWELSQSGRRKQNFGPKCNFKKKKIKLGYFNGFPKFTKFVQDKFKCIPILKGYQAIEQCSLEYNPERGASIDPHIDDCWIWGERIVTVNLLSDSMLTMTYNDKPERYNLDCVKNYPSILNGIGKFNESCECYKLKPIRENGKYPLVRIPMPRQSLLIIFGSARYDWEHQVLREDIFNRRLCLAYREFTPPYLKGGDKYEEGKDILLQATKFWDIS